MIFFSNWRARYQSQAHDAVSPPSAHVLGTSMEVWAPLSLQEQAEWADRSCTQPSRRMPALPAVTSIPVPQAQRWYIPAIKWLQKHLSGWGRVRSGHIGHRHEIHSLGQVICSCRWLQSQTSVLPQDLGVYNPRTQGGSHLQRDVQGVTSRARVTLANTDTEITSVSLSVSLPQEKGCQALSRQYQETQ